MAEPVRRTTQYASPDFTVVPDRINFPYLQSAHDSTQLPLRMVSTQGLGTLIGFPKKAKKFVLDASSLGERPKDRFEDPQVWRPNAKG